MALCYIRYSTWKGPCLYLEDIVVTADQRNRGIGKALFDAVMAYATEKKYSQVNWQVLDWNTPAIRFYEKAGAAFDPHWINVSSRTPFHP
jgi:ribosomal protein S18 acetylase RimI-like enzyme